VQQDFEAFTFEQFVGVLRRRLLLVVLCVVVVAGGAFGFARQQARKYTTTASLSFGVDLLSQQIAGLPASGGTPSSLLAQQASDVERVRFGDMAAKTAAVLGRGLTAGQVASSLTVAGQGESSVVDVSVTASSPGLAAAIANVYSAQFVKEQQHANSLYFKSALALVRKQLAALSPQQRVSAAGGPLVSREQTLTLLAELHYGNAQLAQEAVAPSSPSSPKTSRDTALGGFIGLVLGLGLAFVLERTDRRMRRLKDLESVYRLPLLGAVPKSSVLARGGRGKDGGLVALASSEAEAFSLIRAHLRFFNIDRELRTIMVASAAPGDGKTTIARHLAEAAAWSGSRVLLLESDLRNPTLAQHFGIRPGAGLAEVLIGASTAEHAIQHIDLEASPTEAGKGRTLDVLFAGAVLPPNPTELLESHAMNALLQHAKSSYDLVVIDTPPLAAVSDAFPLLAKVDGVVIVAWVGRSQRDTAAQLQQVLTNSDAPLLGIIANATKTGSPAIYPTHSHHKPPPATPSNNGSTPTPTLTPTNT
jgi:succinoglycan biosynthesis transport protein ExoP